MPVSWSCSWLISALDLGAVHTWPRAATSFDLISSTTSMARLDAGVGRVDRGGAEAQGVLHRAESLVVRAHRRRDRPVGGVVGGVGDAIAGRDAVLRFRQRLVGLGQRLQRGHRCDVRIDATHCVCPSVSLGDVVQNVGHTGSRRHGRAASCLWAPHPSRAQSAMRERVAEKY